MDAVGRVRDRRRYVGLAIMDDPIDDEIADAALLYQRTMRARRAARAEWAALTGRDPKNAPEAVLPQYSPEAREGWAAYARLRRAGRGGTGRPSGRRAADVECGTVARYRQHVRERTRLREKGYSQERVDVIAPIDEECRDAYRKYRAGVR